MFTIIKTFCKNQKEVAEAINYVIDRYWDNEIDEKRMVQFIKDIAHNNDSLLFKNEDFTTVVKQRCGKRRLEIVSKLTESDKANNNCGGECE